MQGARSIRVAQVVREAVTEALAYGAVRDPRVAGNGLITVTHVQVSGDLQHGKIYVVVSGGDAAAALAGLRSAAGFLRRQVAERLQTKAVPELRFFVDEQIEKARRIEQLLAEVAAEKKE